MGYSLRGMALYACDSLLRAAGRAARPDRQPRVPASYTTAVGNAASKASVMSTRQAYHITRMTFTGSFDLE